MRKTVKKSVKKPATFPNAIVKSFNPNVNTSDFFQQFSSSVGYKRQSTPRELLQYNVGWVYTCNTKISQTVTSIPLKLYYKGDKVVKAYKNMPVNKHTKSWLEMSTKKNIENLVEIEDHQVLDLMDNVNDRMNWVDMMQMVVMYLGLLGQAYVYKHKNNEGVVDALYPLMAENVTVIADNGDYGYDTIKQYKYMNPNTQKAAFFEPEDIIHFINYQPGNLLYGKGELEACLYCAQRAQYYENVEAYINENMARPDFMLSFKNGLNEKQQKDLEQMWYKKHGTAKNSGKPMIIGTELEVHELGFSPREMQYQLGRADLRQQISAVFGVPEALLVINESNFASAKAATEHFIEFTIKPKLVRMLEKLNQQFISEFDPDLFLWFDGDFNTSADPKETAELDKIYLDSGVYGPQYVRDRMGIVVEQADVKVKEDKPLNPKPADVGQNHVKDEQ